jgi:drug/metabolite transporter (DMT)-like permease
MSQTADRWLGGNRTTAGIIAMVAFAAIAPGMDAFAKATPADIPIGQVLGFRFSIQALILVPLTIALGHAALPTPRDWFIHLARAATVLAATGFFFAALRFMPITTAISIFFVEPFIVAIMGALFLGERIGPRRIIACFVGFGGALMVIQPTFQDLGLPALFPLATATLFACYIILTRQIAVRSHPIAIQAWTALVAAALMLPLLALFDGTANSLLDPVRPSAFAWMTLLGVGLVATVSHLFLSLSLRLAPASVVAPFQYFEIVAATVLGLAFFGDFPNALTWAGIAIIVGSGVYLFARERVANTAD